MSLLDRWMMGRDTPRARQLHRDFREVFEEAEALGRLQVAERYQGLSRWELPDVAIQLNEGGDRAEAAALAWWMNEMGNQREPDDDAPQAFMHGYVKGWSAGVVTNMHRR
jgi:hypothetical protein